MTGRKGVRLFCPARTSRPDPHPFVREVVAWLTSLRFADLTFSTDTARSNRFFFPTHPRFVVITSVRFSPSCSCQQFHSFASSLVLAVDLPLMRSVGAPRFSSLVPRRSFAASCQQSHSFTSSLVLAVDLLLMRSFRAPRFSSLVPRRSFDASSHFLGAHYTSRRFCMPLHGIPQHVPGAGPFFHARAFPGRLAGRLRRPSSSAPPGPRLPAGRLAPSGYQPRPGRSPLARVPRPGPLPVLYGCGAPGDCPDYLAHGDLTSCALTCGSQESVIRPARTQAPSRTLSCVSLRLRLSFRYADLTFLDRYCSQQSVFLYGFSGEINGCTVYGS